MSSQAGDPGLPSPDEGGPIVQPYPEDVNADQPVTQEQPEGLNDDVPAEQEMPEAPSGKKCPYCGMKAGTCAHPAG